MSNRKQGQRGKTATRPIAGSMLGAAILVLVGTIPASAQLTVLHNFGENEFYENGYVPEGRLVMNSKTGSLFGVTTDGGDEICGGGEIVDTAPITEEGNSGCGGVFELADNSHGVPKVFSRLHVFTSTHGDGAAPTGELVFDTQGDLFGTTSEGGNLACAPDATGCGTVFEEIPPVDGGKWTQKILHAFTAGPKDGAYPEAALKLDPTTQVLYGTTCGGGAFYSGTVFSLTPNGDTYTYAVIHNFQGGPDGGCPEGALAIDTSGNLYGTTNIGGKLGMGVVFELKHGTKGWTETVLHPFAGEPTDVGYPESGLVFSNHSLFGASEGGANNDGAIFELSLVGGVWTESLAYSFQANPGAYNPVGDKLAVDQNGDLFGATSDGGANDEGAIYELVNNAGSYTLTILYSFCALANCADGAYPEGGVILDAAGNIYGTTEYGVTGFGGNAYMFKP
jgi:uncharacterized repeat protein (TIGR03803 family)